MLRLRLRLSTILTVVLPILNAGVLIGFGSVAGWSAEPFLGLSLQTSAMLWIWMSWLIEETTPILGWVWGILAAILFFVGTVLVILAAAGLHMVAMSGVAVIAMGPIMLSGYGLLCLVGLVNVIGFVVVHRLRVPVARKWVVATSVCLVTVSFAIVRPLGPPSSSSEGLSMLAALALIAMMDNAIVAFAWKRKETDIDAARALRPDRER